jgi:hypothetical protein
MASTYRAHIFKQRQVGEREEVKIKYFDGGHDLEGLVAAGPRLQRQ